MIDFSRYLQLVSLYCSSFKDFLMFLSACLVAFVAFAIIKMFLKVRYYV